MKRGKRELSGRWERGGVDLATHTVGRRAVGALKSVNYLTPQLLMREQPPSQTSVAQRPTTKLVDDAIEQAISDVNIDSLMVEKAIADAISEYNIDGDIENAIEEAFNEALEQL